MSLAGPACAEAAPTSLRRILWLLPLTALGSLTYSILTTEWSSLESMVRIDGRFLLLAVALAFVPWLTNSLRLRNWLRFFGHEVSLVHTLRAVISGELGASVSPTALGGGPFKVAALREYGVPLSRSTAMLGLGTLEDGCFALVVMPAGLILTGLWRAPLAWDLDWLSPEWSWLLVPLLVGLLAMLVDRFFLRKTLKHRLRKSWRGFRDGLRDSFRLVGRRGAGTLARNILLAIVQGMARYSIITALVAGLGFEASPLRMAVTQWLCFTAMTLIPTPGAAGGAEASFLLLFHGTVPDATMGLAMFLWRFFTFYMLVGTALVVFLMLGGGPSGQARVPDSGRSSPASGK